MVTAIIFSLILVALAGMFLWSMWNDFKIYQALKSRKVEEIWISGPSGPVKVYDRKLVEQNNDR